MGITENLKKGIKKGLGKAGKGIVKYYTNPPKKKARPTRPKNIVIVKHVHVVKSTPYKPRTRKRLIVKPKYKDPYFG